MRFSPATRPHPRTTPGSRQRSSRWARTGHGDRFCHERNDRRATVLVLQATSSHAATRVSQCPWTALCGCCSDQATAHLVFESCRSTHGGRLKGRKNSATCYVGIGRLRASPRKRSPSAPASAVAASPIWNAAPGAFHIRTPPRVWQRHLSWARPSGRRSWPPAGQGGLGRPGATRFRSNRRRLSDDNASLARSPSSSSARDSSRSPVLVELARLG